MSQNEPTEDEVDALDTVLSFYSSQLTSHASILVASLIAFLTLIQVRLSLGSNPSELASATLLVLMSGIIVVGLYALVRLVIYGGLSSTIIHGYAKEFVDFRKALTNNPRLPHGLANEYALFTFRKRQRLISKFYNLRSPSVYVIVPISFAVSYTLLFLVLTG